MNSCENMAFMVTFISYSVAMVFYLLYFVSRKTGAGKLATTTAGIGWIANTIALVVRSINAGRLPFANGYEFLLAFAWGTILVYLWFEYRHKFKTAGLFVLPLAWLLLAYVAVKIPVEQKLIVPLMPALKSHWLSVHVATAVIAYGAFALSFGLAIMYLLREREDIDNRPGRERLIERLPDAELLDELSYKTIMFGFFFMALVIVSGAIWAEQAWGSYWCWDPKETWSLITWLIYGGYLHARLTHGWRGRPAAVLAVIGFVAVLFTFFGVNYLLAGLHSYA